MDQLLAAKAASGKSFDDIAAGGTVAGHPSHSGAGGRVADGRDPSRPRRVPCRLHSPPAARALAQPLLHMLAPVLPQSAAGPMHTPLSSSSTRHVAHPLLVAGSRSPCVQPSMSPLQVQPTDASQLLDCPTLLVRASCIGMASAPACALVPSRHAAPPAFTMHAWRMCTPARRLQAQLKPESAGRLKTAVPELRWVS